MTAMRSLPVAERVHSFAEVALGFDEAEVEAEAERCIQCKHPVCVDGCPNHNPIPTFISLVREGRYAEAAAVDYLQNALPSCTGRVCAWEQQCEGRCVLHARGEGVRIGAIERFIADYALRHPDEVAGARAAMLETAAAVGRTPGADAPYGAVVSAYSAATPEDAPEWDGRPDPSLIGREVAVVGAGPAGLACADFLSRLGAGVTVWEAQQQAGGLLADGIPEFVLPSATVGLEVERLRGQGVRFRFGEALGRDVELEALQHGHDAVFLAIGASLARKMGIPGEDSRGVVTAQEFLHRGKLALLPGPDAQAPDIGAHVLIVGAGNTAMDAARTAVRLGASDVRVVYRRTEAESPSRRVEIHHTVDEGVRFEYLVNPVAFLADGGGRLRAVRLERMRLGKPDSSGRPRPEPIPDSAYELPCDTAILAVGYAVAGTDLQHPEMLARGGAIRTVDPSGATERGGIFAGGDAVRGPATVVEAVHDGRVAAHAIAAYLARLPRAAALAAGRA